MAHSEILDGKVGDSPEQIRFVASHALNIRRSRDCQHMYGRYAARVGCRGVTEKLSDNANL